LLQVSQMCMMHLEVSEGIPKYTTAHTCSWPITSNVR